ncbi:MAG: hypothetical protein FJ280_23180 [Planctomycetes bacterium]|nr:hypothetical protein [Planctomycetota bacterium]
MWRVSVIVGWSMLACTSSAHAWIGRTQGFDIGAVNRILWGGGIGSATGETQTSFSQTQQFSEHHRYSSISGTQSGRGSLSQTATAHGTGFSTVRQTADIGGSQSLSASPAFWSSGAWGRQGLEVRLDTRLFQPNGSGSVSGTQAYNGQQEQSLATPYSTSSQSQSVDVRQSGSINPTTDTDPIVRNTVTMNLRQSQMMNGR